MDPTSWPYDDLDFPLTPTPTNSNSNSTSTTTSTNITQTPTDPSCPDYLPYISTYISTTLSPIIWPINLKIHDNPELNYEEHIAHDTLTGFLETRPGWKVTRHAYGIETAFVAVFDGGREGPVVSFNAEYDALPGVGVHACGHNLIMSASLAAALTTASTMEKHSLPGKVILFGTPAEEGGGGKIKLLNAGAYTSNKVDVSLMAHPGTTPDAALVSTAAYLRFRVEYFGKEAHAAAAPWEGINALDALITAYNALSVLRQQSRPGSIIQGHITSGGAAPNVIHAYAAGVFIVRANTKPDLSHLFSKVKACFVAGATATGAKLSLTVVSGYDDMAPNHTLGYFYRHFFNQLSGDGTTIPPPEIDIIEGRSGASTDQGNVSHAMPALHPGFQIESKEGPHNPGFADAARTREAFEKALMVAKALAATGVEVLARKGLREEAWKEWRDTVKE
ncbi:MAG: hypothetical protein M1834_003689 [Cirrosporium novae-zelandiae]|nr:MAG: hypothetical protein M1834_003689 [Cirrosporium novae-zelandiae]